MHIILFKTVIIGKISESTIAFKTMENGVWNLAKSSPTWIFWYLYCSGHRIIYYWKISSIYIVRYIKMWWMPKEIEKNVVKVRHTCTFFKKKFLIYLWKIKLFLLYN